MNAHQRRKFAVWKHSRLPLQHPVLVAGVACEIFKHDSQRPHLCMVKYPDGQRAWVPLAQVKSLKQVKVRPWWRVFHDRVRSGEWARSAPVPA